MAAITWTDVTDLDSSLSTVAASVQAWILGDVNNMFDVAIFGGEDHLRTKEARVLAAAHAAKALLSGAGSGGALSGPVTSESEGDLSRSYGFSGSGFDANALGLTVYGQLLYGLIRRCAGARVPLVL